MFNLTCLHQSLSLLLSLALSLSLHLQTRFGSRSDLNGIQDRMFRQFKIVCTQSVNTVECPTLPYKRRCAQKVWVFIGSSCNKIDWLTQTLCFYILRNQAKTKDSCANTVQSLSFSLTLSLSVSTFTTCYQSLQTVFMQKIVQRAWSGANKHTKSYNLVRLCLRRSQNISDKYLLSDACMGRSRGGGGYWSGSP